MSPGDIWPRLQTSLAVITGRELLFRSSVEKLAMLLNAYGTQGSPHRWKAETKPKMSMG